MRLLPRYLAPLAGFASALLSWSVGGAIARACPADACQDLPLPGASLPANAFAVEIPDPAQSQPALTDVAGQSIALVTTPVSAGVWLATAAAPLVPGTRYTFRRNRLVQVTTASRAVECQVGADAVSVDFVALSPAPYPPTLGTVGLQTLSSGAVTAELALSEAAAPFSGLLQVSVFVDGLPLADPNGGSAGLRTRATVTRDCAGGSTEALDLDACGDVASLGPGPHGLTFSARIPGAPSVIASDPVLVSPTCASTTPVPIDDVGSERGTGCNLAGGESSSVACALVAIALGLTLARRARRSR